MPIKIVRNDISKMSCDAIVNAANSTLLGGGGVDGAIHRAAGKGLLEECRALGGCRTGDAVATGAYNLPCKYVIHTVGPLWRGGNCGEKELLSSCYDKSLRLAKKLKCESVAFPLISSGAYGYPKDEAFRVAVDSIGGFLTENEMLVYLVIFDKAMMTISRKLFDDIQSFIDDNYAEAHYGERKVLSRTVASLEGEASPPAGEALALKAQPPSDAQPLRKALPLRSGQPHEQAQSKPPAQKGTAAEPRPVFTSLDEAIKQMDESFSETLLRKIDEKGMKDPECYKRANIDRKLFSKIRSDRHYRPSKPTAVAFAIALRLSLPETAELLRAAGFALSRSSKFDIIVEYFIRRRNYDIYEINSALFEFDQSLLGC